MSHPTPHPNDPGHRVWATGPVKTGRGADPVVTDALPAPMGDETTEDAP